MEADQPNEDKNNNYIKLHRKFHEDNDINDYLQKLRKPYKRFKRFNESENQSESYKVI